MPTGDNTDTINPAYITDSGTRLINTDAGEDNGHSHGVTHFFPGAFVWFDNRSALLYFNIYHENVVIPPHGCFRRRGVNL